jgi:hypothetical protein
VPPPIADFKHIVHHFKRSYRVANLRLEAYECVRKWRIHAMTTSEINREVKNIRDLAKEVGKSPEKGKELLYMTGIYTKNGNLKKKFR